MPAPPPPSRKKKAPRHGSSLPLLAFAGAKKTTYDPRVAKQKASNLAAKRVNDFRKLKARLAAEGKLAVPSSIAWATMDAAAAAEGGGEEEVEVPLLLPPPLPPPPPPPFFSSSIAAREATADASAASILSTAPGAAPRSSSTASDAAPASCAASAVLPFTCASRRRAVASAEGSDERTWSRT